MRACVSVSSIRVCVCAVCRRLDGWTGQTSGRIKRAESGSGAERVRVKNLGDAVATHVHRVLHVTYGHTRVQVNGGEETRRRYRHRYDTPSLVLSMGFRLRRYGEPDGSGLMLRENVKCTR